MATKTAKSSSDTATTAMQTSMDARRNSWLASGLSLDEVAILLASQAKAARKMAKHSDVTERLPREKFAKVAKPKVVTIDGVNYTAEIRANSPDKSYGWNISQKVTVEVDGEEYDFQLGFNLTLIGSKPVK